MDCPISEVFFGGARGGGKTDGVLGKWALKEKRYGASFNAIMFRRTTVSSEDAIERSREIYSPLGGKFNGSKLQWRMPHGGRVSFAYLDTVADADQYQGRNVTDAWVEEAGQYPDPTPIDRLFGVLRSSKGVPIQLILTGNPGGAGQMWISRRYGMVPFPAGPKIVERTLPNGAIHRAAVIPSRITDNRIMLDADPGYIDRLHLVGSEQLVKAWLDGDWSAIEGAFFECWSEAKHVIAPFEIPQHWTRICSFDWGSASPFSVGWWAVASDDTERPEGLIPKGAMVRYREWYGAKGPNQGIKMANEDIARGIKKLEAEREVIALRVADPRIFAEEGGPSISEQMGREGVHWGPADNKRVPRAGAIGGWAQMRSRLVGHDGRPMLYAFNTCPDFIRTIPALQHSLTNAEDVNSEMEDHAADEARYACMARPWTAPNPNDQRPATNDWGRPRRNDAHSWRTV